MKIFERFFFSFPPINDFGHSRGWEEIRLMFFTYFSVQPTRMCDALREAVPTVEKPNVRRQAIVSSEAIFVENWFMSDSGSSNPVAPLLAINRCWNTFGSHENCKLMTRILL